MILDALCGYGGWGNLPKYPAIIDHFFGDHIAAIVLYGDPRHNAQVSYNRGTSTHDGVCIHPSTTTPLHTSTYLTSAFPQVIPRVLPDQNCDYYASKIHSYCDINDPFCDGTLLTTGCCFGVHVGYSPKYDQDAADFVNKLL